MMKLTNTKDHTNVIIVSRAYVNGNLIVCDSGNDVFDVWADCWKLESLPEQPVSDHHEIEVEFRGEKVTISREFYRNGERNYSTREQDDNAIWAALRAWCEKKGITPFELYPKQPDLETADLLAIAHLQGMEQQKAKMMEEAVEANLLSVDGDSYGIVSYTFQGRRFPAAFSGKCSSYKIIVIKDEK